MSRVSQGPGRLIERILRQRRWVTLMHGTAILVVPYCYWIGHAVPLAPNARGGGSYAFAVSIYAWAPVLISWCLTRNPNEGTVWFRLWLALFVAINLAACVVYLGYEPLPLKVLAWSAIHTVLLAAIVPLAISRELEADS